MGAIQQALAALGGAGGGGGPPVTTWDPVNKGTGVTLSGGDLVADCAVDSKCAISSSGHATGKYSAEVLIGTQDTTFSFVGICTEAQDPETASDSANANYRANGTVSGGTNGAAWAAGDVVGIDIDADTGEVTFSLNGTPGGGKTLATGSTYYIVAYQTWGPGTYVFTAQFSLASRTHGLPSGYSAFGG